MKYSRSRLLDAIKRMRGMALGVDDDWEVILEGAEAYASSSMPKEIDVWDVEYAVKLEDGWYPSIIRYSVLEGAEAFADVIRKSDVKMSEPVIIKRTAEVPNE